MSSTTMLSAAAAERKARLAQLKSLKRKQPSDDDSAANEPSAGPHDAPTSPRPAKSPRVAPASLPQAQDPGADDISATILSGRNYDPLTRGPKLGFETNPSAAASSASATVEQRAQALADEVKTQLAAERAEAAAAARDDEEAADGEQQQHLDLFKLRPKKPNWDLKRRLEERMRPVDVRTENAIARLVRERIEGKRKDGVAAAGVQNTAGSGVASSNAAGVSAGGEGDDGELGMEGTTLVEATKEREREAEEDARRDREADEELEAS